MNAWGLLSVAIVAEVVATVALRFSEGMTRWGPTAVVVVGYGVAFLLLSRVVQHLSAGVTYAVWAGAGTALVAVVGVLALGEAMTWPKAASLVLIMAGVAGLHLYGESASHRDGAEGVGASAMSTVTSAPAAPSSTGDTPTAEDRG